MDKFVHRTRYILLVLGIAFILGMTFASPATATTTTNTINDYSHDYRSYNEYLEELRQKQLGPLPTAKPLPSEATPEPIPEYLLSGGQIAGLVIGSLAVIVLIAAMFSYSLKNHERIESWGM